MDCSRVAERNGRIVVTDLRMGQEPYYSFNFVVGQRQSPEHRRGHADRISRAARPARGRLLAVAPDAGRKIGAATIDVASFRIRR